ncbi:cell wall-active antibiotics response protein LiaF [Pseudalkalibacillus salsuginis]|uniref:cell wall-active antibiotics response protein LiaF n=1 Tax=Pseudalkalibacillus salsuginis TaxID=2910972 RepID=UPI001F45FEF4|nr:cell wall-active antibiotics response protein LiaF [Pseudalkalibacillus salsuginis]MCF6411291.1 cell wall-active antibiotics response protein LiaF [Pseudalkalibacillus salsuginis]
MKTKTDKVSWLLIIGVILLLLEISFHGMGPIFFLILTAGCIYVGRKKYDKMIGKLLFWFGVVAFALTILNTMAFKFLLIALFIYAVIQFAQSKQDPAYITPDIQEPQTVARDQAMFKRRPLLKNNLFGRQQTPEHAYEWNDVNIQCGIGDTVIDLGNTVLPKGESTIVIRSFVGNIKILVPYELDVSIGHSVIAGTSRIFEHYESKMFNQCLSYQSAGFEQSHHRVKIITSMMIGDLEVKRT